MSPSRKKIRDYAFIAIVGVVSEYLYCQLFDIDFEKYYKVLALLPLIGSAGLYILLAPVLALFSPVYSSKIIKAKWGLGKDDIAPAADYIRLKQETQDEYCLVLRPFGNDAFFSLNNITSQYYFDTLISNWSQGIVIEQVIEAALMKQGIKETVALVDPRLQAIPSSPKFISSANETWQWVVYDLLKRSLFIFVIIPPGIKISDALVWEITKMVQIGLLGRFAIILPPQPLASNRKTIAEIKNKLYFISDMLETIDDATCVIYPNGQHGVDHYYNSWHRMPEKIRKTHSETLSMAEYAKFLDDVIIKMLQSITHLSYGEKYLYRSTVFDEDDKRFSAEYVQLFLKNQRGPYRADD